MSKSKYPHLIQVGSQLYEDIPKAVWASLAIALALRKSDEVEAVIAHEWMILHEDGIVPQAPSRMAKTIVADYLDRGYEF